MYIAKDDGSSAQQDMYIPEANMRNVNVNRPTWFPNCRQTPLQCKSGQFDASKFWFQLHNQLLSFLDFKNLTDKNISHTTNNKTPTNTSGSKTARSTVEVVKIRISFYLYYFLH